MWLQQTIFFIMLYPAKRGKGLTPNALLLYVFLFEYLIACSEVAHLYANDEKEKVKTCLMLAELSLLSVS